MAAVGPATIIRNKIMTTDNSNNNDNTDKKKIKQVIKILRFILTEDDEEIIKSSIESVIEMLEEID